MPKKTTKQPKPTKAKVEVIPISQEMKQAYLDYAMSVIVSRALPDVRDGLKPVHRRIIYAMQEGGHTHSSKYVKCAAVVGDTMKKFHPHAGGLYEALARMAQPFSMRYPLVDGQGNFGSIDGHPPAAMRYTECRLDKLSSELLEGIDKETVDFLRNYSGDYYEPAVLPAKVPNLLLNGSIGIAVGMATSIPPHNLGEVLDGVLLTIEKGQPVETKNPLTTDNELIKPLAESFIKEDLTPKKWYRFASQVTVDELVAVIKGPDFPTGGTIYDKKEVVAAYTTGKGRIVTRAKTEIMETKGGKYAIVITEIPYLVNKAVLIAKIADLVKNKRITGISVLRDESDRSGLRIYIELKKDSQPQRILNQLYKLTELQKPFHVNMIGLIKNEPQVLSLKTILEEFVSHRQEIITRRTIYLLRKTKEREHILQGLKIALDHLDEVIETIKKSQDTPTAQANLIKKFGLSAIQATAILDMPLKRLSALEQQKIEDELKEKLALIKKYGLILENPDKVLEIIKQEIGELKEKYGDKRRTKVIKGKVGEISEEETVKEEDVIVSLTESGYIKRLPINTYKVQARGGKGVIGAQLREGDEVYELRIVNTHDTILFFSNRGKVYSLRAWDIPPSTRRSKGTAIVNLISITSTEEVTAMIPIPANMKAAEKDKQFLFLTTRDGTVKRTPISKFENIRRSGIMAIRLSEGDKLGWVELTDGLHDIILTTAQGKSIRFAEQDARSMGRAAGGVRGIRLNPEDGVVGMNAIPPKTKGKLLVVTEKGYGKQTSLKEYRQQKRGGSGIVTLEPNQRGGLLKRTGSLVAARVVNSEIKDILMTSKEGQIIRIPLKKISTLGRATQGVRVMRLKEGDSLIALACLPE